MKYTDISGKTIGYLTVLERAGVDPTGKNSMWLCRCLCGNTVVVNRTSLSRSESNGFIASCGCRKHASRNYTHGMSKTRLYHTWLSMRKRCSNANGKDFKSYEGRGVKVCEEWDNSFTAFMDWALLNGYSEDLTLDRIDVNKGYYPENCRWITISSQQANKQNTVHVIYNGECWCLRTLCEAIGFPYKTAHCRYSSLKKRGEEITAEKLFKPIEKNKIAKRFRDA